jgi:hypothetical protein
MSTPDAGPLVVEQLMLEGTTTGAGVLVVVVVLDTGYRLSQKDSIVGNSCLIPLFQEKAQEALVKFCETFETTDWSTPYSAAPWATENSAITEAIALDLKFSKSFMASAAGAAIEVTQLSTFRCDGLSDAVELRDWFG